MTDNHNTPKKIPPEQQKVSRRGFYIISIFLFSLGAISLFTPKTLDVIGFYSEDDVFVNHLFGGLLILVGIVDIIAAKFLFSDDLKTKWQN